MSPDEVMVDWFKRFNDVFDSGVQVPAGLPPFEQPLDPELVDTKEESNDSVG